MTAGELPRRTFLGLIAAVFLARPRRKKVLTGFGAGGFGSGGFGGTTPAKEA